MKSSTSLLLAVVFAIALPWCALHFTSASQRQDLGLSVPLFAYPRLFAFHMIFMVPLAIVTIHRLRQWPTFQEAHAMLWLLFGVASLLITPMIMNGLAELQLQQNDFLLGLLGRSVCAWMLVLPWLGFALKLSKDIPKSLDWRLAVLIGVLPVSMYSFALQKAQHKRVVEYLQRDRLAKAHLTLQGLLELGLAEKLGQQSPQEMFHQLEQNLQALERRFGSDSFALLTSAEKLELAAAKIQLNQLRSAQKILGSETWTDPQAVAFVGIVEQELENWSRSNELLEPLLPELQVNPSLHSLWKMVLESIAFNYQQLGDDPQALRIWQLGLQKSSEEAGYFHTKLAETYANLGRIQEAMNHLEQAESLGSEGTASLRRDLQMNTPGCFRWR